MKDTKKPKNYEKEQKELEEKLDKMVECINKLKQELLENGSFLKNVEGVELKEEEDYFSKLMDYREELGYMIGSRFIHINNKDYN